eukprot:TRINITY_DN93408_c0_g1_i1.p2 TRINITY_DN93408_c0_g1~~TRINITY_DN93408_c0_g1_i1.p2  ORF type:complete len:174 (-),score=22.02 TRINITY_DN93408_c0_g1_i1:260-781(-)
MSTSLAFESHPNTLRILACTDVSNAANIKSSIAGKSLAVEAAFIDADVVADLFMVHLAAFKALSDKAADSLTTHSLHSDIVFNLAGSRHISQALNTFGVSPDTKHLLVARLDATPEELDTIRSVVSGSEISVDECLAFRNLERLRKLYKTSDEELKVGTIADVALSKLAVHNS